MVGHSIPSRDFFKAVPTPLWTITVTLSHLGHPALRWEHILNSRPPSNLPDQGSFTTLPNGDVSERGVMYNPKTNLIEDYVEIWRRIPIKSLFTKTVTLLERADIDNGKAYIGQYGDHALGVGVSVMGRFQAWRAEWDSGRGEWRVVYDFGGAVDALGILPGDQVQWQAGQIVILESGTRWLVREHKILNGE